LPCHTIDHQVNLLWTYLAIDTAELVHQLFVDVQAAGRV
jgi:hypothetical protein